MVSSLTELRQHLSRVKPWVGVAVLLAVALLGYYSVLGMRYLDASERVASLNSEIRQLTASLGKPLPDEEALRAERESQEQRLKTVRSLFNYPESDDLVGVFSATAREAAVALGQVTVGDRRLEPLGEIHYWTQPMVATLQGETVDIFMFLSLLQQKVPMAQVVSISMSGLEGLPSAQVQLVFYLSPQAASE